MHGTSYNWTVPNGLTLSSGQTTDSISIMADSVGSYVITVYAANDPCVLNGPVDSFTVTVNALPVFTAMTNDTAICVGDTVTLTASDTALTYAWVPGNASGAMVHYSPSTPTSYTVTGTNSNGCSSTAMVYVNVHALPAISAVTSDTAICVGDSVTLSANGAISYLWMPGGDSTATTTANPTSTTTYTVTGTNVYGCSSMALVTVHVNQLPAVSLTLSKSTICVYNAPYAIAGGSPSGGTYSGTGVSSGNFNPTTAGVGSHIITYTYVDTVTGCSNSSYDTIVVSPCTGINENNLGGVYLVSNAVQSQLQARWDSKFVVYSYEIHDVMGRIVSAKQISNSNSADISVEELPAGNYYITFSTKEGEKAQIKFVKQ